MCGWEHVGFRLPNGLIRYTDWGLLGMELHAQFWGKETKPKGDLLLSSVKMANEKDLVEFLLERICADTKGEIPEGEYAKLVSDNNWIIDGDRLWSPKRSYFLQY